MSDISKGDKVRLVIEGVWNCTTANGFHALSVDCFGEEGRTTKLELIEKTVPSHDFEADEYGTLYTDSSDLKYVKIKGMGGDIYRRVDSVIFLKSEDAALRLTPVDKTPEFGDRNWGWKDKDGDTWFYSNGWWCVGSHADAVSCSENNGSSYNLLPNTYSPYTPYVRVD